MRPEDMTANQHAQAWVDRLKKLQELGPVFGMVATMQFDDAKNLMTDMPKTELVEWARKLNEASQITGAMLNAFKTVLMLQVIRDLKAGTLNFDDFNPEGE